MTVWWRACRRAAALALVAAVVACGTSAAPLSEPAPAGARTYPEYAAGACAALQSLWRAWGNPDTAALSPMQHAFDDAAKAGDVATATVRAAEVRDDMERGRASAAIAARWAPGAESMHQTDRLLLAFEALVEAKLAATPIGYREATDSGQAAFVSAGGIEAWHGMLRGIGEAINAAGQSWPACEGIPIG